MTRRSTGLDYSSNPATKSYYVISVPNDKQPQIVVSQFAVADNKLSREALLTAGAGVSLRDGSDLAQYYPVGADFRDGNLYLLSKAYNSLLVVDAATLAVTAVHGLPEIGDYSDLVVTKDAVFVLSRQDGTDVVYTLSGLPKS